MNESILRLLIRENILGAFDLNDDGGGAGTIPTAPRPSTSAPKTYTDVAGYKFQIQNGKLMLIARPAGATGNNKLPFEIPSSKLQASLKVLMEKYPNDPGLAALSTSKPPPAEKDSPKPPPAENDSQKPPEKEVPPKTPAEKESKKTSGLFLDSNIVNKYPVTADQIRKSNDFIHQRAAGVENCSEWAKQFVGKQGNAWTANRQGALKFNAFGNLESYKAESEKIFADMNAKPGLSAQTAKSFNDRVKAIVQSILPSPQSLKDTMKIGDIIGLYYEGSGHHGEAFFESCSGWSLTQKKQLVYPAVQTSDGKKWDSSMLGKKENFIINTPFAMNTHLGFVGGTIDGEPLIFHNMTGDVHVNRLSTITSAKCYPIWIKQGNSQLNIVDYSKATEKDVQSLTADFTDKAYDILKRAKDYLI